MRVVVVGGGCAGLVTAHLLDRAHEVIVLERAPVPGGHVRTLGRNVTVPGLGGLVLDAGVIELESTYFPTVFRLLRRLDVAVERVPGHTTLFLPDGRRLLSPGAIDRHVLGRLRQAWWRLSEQRQVWDRLRFLRATEGLDEAALRERTLGAMLPSGWTGVWMELLSLYAYSTPRPDSRQLPAALAVPMLRDFVNARAWYRVVGGVYTYLERILDGLRGAVHTGVGEVRVRREGGLAVWADGERVPADAVVFATPPDQVLRVLEDPSPDERRRFGGWAARQVQTVVHRDPGPYTRRGATFATEFDVFDLGDGRGAYNANLDRLCGLGDGRWPCHGLAFGLEDELDPAAILHVQPHHAPRYTVEALRWREEVRRTNGERGTWHAGAWLGDGLHEGAVRSAVAVATALGGEPV